MVSRDIRTGRVKPMLFSNRTIAVKLKWTIFFLVSCLFYAILGPNGVDWEYYSVVKPNYDHIYFQREFFSWFVIDVVNSIDESGVLMAGLVSSLLTFGTMQLTILMTKDAVIATLITVMLFLSNFYLLMSVNGIRQGISLGLLLVALYNYHAGSKKFIVLFVFAVFSHNSAILFGPLFFVRAVPAPLYFVGTAIAVVLADFIISVAGKNDNISVTQNKQIFLSVSALVVVFSLLHRMLGKYKIIPNLGKTEHVQIVVYIFLMSTAFYSSSAVYERLVYSSVPLLVIYFAYLISSYRPRPVVIFGIILISGAFSFYSLSHPSVSNNFLAL